MRLLITQKIFIIRQGQTLSINFSESFLKYEGFCKTGKLVRFSLFVSITSIQKQHRHFNPNKFIFVFFIAKHVQWIDPQILLNIVC